MRRKSQREELDDMMVRPIPKKKIGIVHLEMVKEISYIIRVYALGNV